MEQQINIGEVCEFLNPKNRLDVRIAAAEALKIFSARPLLELVELNMESALPTLIKYIGDVESISNPIIDCLVNLCAVGILTPTSSCICDKPSFWANLVETPEAFSALLLNLTSQVSGPEKVEELYIGGVGKASAELLGKYKKGFDSTARNKQHSEQIKANVISILRNLTTLRNARAFLVESVALLNTLVETMIFANSYPLRRDAAGCIRHILVDKDQGWHAKILRVTEGGGWILVGLLLCGKNTSWKELNDTLDDERKERDHMSPCLLKFFSGSFSFFKEEDTREYRDILMDCLLRLCATRFGRVELRGNKMYPAIRAYHPLETDEAISEKIYSVVDFLLAEEEEFSQGKQRNEEEEQAGGDATWSVD